MKADSAFFGAFLSFFCLFFAGLPDLVSFTAASFLGLGEAFGFLALGALLPPPSSLAGRFFALGVGASACEAGANAQFFDLLCRW